MKPKSRSPSFSMRPKTRNMDKTMSILPQNNNPGAGSYENPEALSPNGRYSLTKHKGTGSSTFNPKRSVRFFQFRNLSFYLENINPGPGNYESVNLMSEKGHYPVSSTWGFGKRAFDKERRETIFDFRARKDSSIFSFNLRSRAWLIPLTFGFRPLRRRCV